MTDLLPTYEQIVVRDRNAVEDVRERLMAECPGALAILGSYDFVICPRADYQPYERQWKEGERNAEARDKAAREAKAAEAIPYRGAIERCQVSVHDGRLAMRFYRCQRPTRYVRRIKDDPEGDGRIAVCATHRKDPKRGGEPRRHVGRGRYEQATAGEVVEPEYQP